MIMGLCSHQMKIIYLQPVMLVLSLLGDYGNKCDYRLTSRVGVIFPPLLDVRIVVTLTFQVNIIFSFSFCMQSYFSNLLGSMQYCLPISKKHMIHPTNPSPMLAFTTVIFTNMYHIMLWTSALR